MANRKKRARRHDPRSMTRDEYVRRMFERYRAEWRRWWTSYNQRYGNSPYASENGGVAIDRLRYP